MKNFNDTIGNRTRDLPACSAVPQRTAPSPNEASTQHSLVDATCVRVAVVCPKIRLPKWILKTLVNRNWIMKTS